MQCAYYGIAILFVIDNINAITETNINKITAKNQAKPLVVCMSAILRVAAALISDMAALCE